MRSDCTVTSRFEDETNRIIFWMCPCRPSLRPLLFKGFSRAQSRTFSHPPYPFARLRKLFEGIVPAEGKLEPISLGIGEPCHPIPQCICDAIAQNVSLMSSYPGTAGSPALREAISAWCERRYGLAPDPATEILPVLGTREALFSLVQCLVDPTVKGGAKVVMPVPFYQIYEGATFLAGADPVYLPLTRENGYKLDLSVLSPDTLSQTQLVYICSPGNPTGSVFDLDDWNKLFALSDRYGFVIASDECYSEIYFEEGNAPIGAMTAAKACGRTDLKNIIVLNSLSKRSNAPGLRSGFVAGDCSLIASYLLYRTYHGSAMNPMIQAASIAAWNDEAHVVENRRLYREKFAVAQPILNSVIDAPMPQASFYLWANVGEDDEVFARELYRQTGVTVLPGSYLSRNVTLADDSTMNPGAGYVRIALVAEPERIGEAAERIRNFALSRK